MQQQFSISNINRILGQEENSKQDTLEIPPIPPPITRASGLKRQYTDTFMSPSTSYLKPQDQAPLIDANSAKRRRLTQATNYSPTSIDDDSAIDVVYINKSVKVKLKSIQRQVKCKSNVMSQLYPTWRQQHAALCKAVDN